MLKNEALKEREGMGGKMLGRKLKDGKLKDDVEGWEEGYWEEN